MNLDQKYLLWRYVPDILHPSHEDPRGIDRKNGLITNFRRDRPLDKGLYKEKSFYDRDTEELVIFEDFKYQFNEIGEPTIQSITTKYAIDGGGFGDFVKYQEIEFTKDQRISRSFDMREAILNSLLSNARQLGVLPQVQDMFRELDNQLNAFKTTGDKSIIVAVGNYEGAWLDDNVPNAPYTLRQAILGELNI